MYVCIYLYKETNMLCINNSNNFFRSCSHLNKIIETSSILHKKKAKNKSPENSKVILLFWYYKYILYIYFIVYIIYF